MKVREPAVAGSFYPGTRAGIQNLIRNIREEEFPNIDTSLAEKYIFGAIVPHAGYEYSGYEAIHVFEILRLSGQEYETVSDHQSESSWSWSFNCHGYKRQLENAGWYSAARP
jgi:MEMO1 family protein